jgi:chemosensory pili system protein ChpA (sensor histidine kinase/response regulator)
VRAPQEQVRIRADLLDRLVNYAGEVAIYRARLEQQLGAFRANLAELDQTTTRLREQLRRLDIETEAQIVARYQREGETDDERFDPLELDRFTNQQQLTRALNESANDLVNLQGVLDELTRQYETLLLQQSRVSSDLQEGLMRTRMVPFDALVPRLRRVLRQAAIDTGKQVQLKVDGASGEMDRNVLDRMTAPLEHMLRNSMAHGLESPEDRRKAKKPEEGTVRIAVLREGSEVVLKVSDDGRGLNKDAIRRKAIGEGLIAPDAELSDEAIYALILEGGFSTAETVTACPAAASAWTWSTAKSASSAARCRSSPIRARAASSPSACRSPSRSRRRCSSRSATPASRCRSPRCAASAAFRRADLDKQLGSGSPVFEYAGEDYAIHDLGTLIGHAPAQGAGQPADAAAAGPLRRPAHRDPDRPGAGQPRNRGQAGRPAGQLGARHLRRTIMGDGRVVVILDVAPLVRRHVAHLAHMAATPESSTPAGRCAGRAAHPGGDGGRRLDHHAQGHRPRARAQQHGSADREGRRRRGREDGRARARPGAARHRDAAHGRLRGRAEHEERPAPEGRADHHDHLAYRRQAPPARDGHRRRPLPRQAVPGARTDAQRVRRAGHGGGQ